MLLFALACSQPTTLDAPAVQTWTNFKALELEARVLDADGDVLDEPAVVIVSSSDEAVVKVAKDGTSYCKNNGSSSLELKAGELTATVQVQCAIVKQITVPKTLRVLLDDGNEQALRLDYSVEGPEGVHDLPVTITSSAPEVVQVGEGGALTALAFGKADITVAVSDKAETVTVEVGRQLDGEAGLKVKDGEGHGITLEAGRYETVVASDQPVTVHFAGTDCESDEALEHELTCTLEKAGTLRIENPGLLGMGGGTASTYVKLIQLP